MGNKITRRRTVIDERYTRPQGLYPCRDVDQRKLRRLILESKLAPCYPGAEDAEKDLEECPICFLQYPSLNRSKCCAKGICTECFLQMKAPHPTRPTQCPFCKTPCYAVEYRGAKTLEEKGMEQAEEQKVIEAKIRMRQQELQDDVEREQRRQEDTRAGRVRLPTPTPTPTSVPTLRAQPNDTKSLPAVTPSEEMEAVNRRFGWGNADSQTEVLGMEERNTSGMDPYALWVDGDYQRAGGLDVTAPDLQSNSMPAVTQQQAETHFATPRFPPGAPRARHREEEFDLDLEDIMVMEAIWLSIQEQGARHRLSEANPTRSRNSEALTEISLDSESDDDDDDDDLALAGLPPPLHLRAVPEAQAWEARGSLAGAIAALAERQAAVNTGDTTTPAAAASSQPAPPSLREEEELSTPAEEALEVTPERMVSRDGGQSYSAAAGGESSSTSSDGVKLSFEQQMVLAMALSFADAQARIHQRDSRSGPLLQPAHMEH